MQCVPAFLLIDSAFVQPVAPAGSVHHYYAYSVHAKHWRLKLHQTEDATKISGLMVGAMIQK